VWLFKLFLYFSQERLYQVTLGNGFIV